MPKRRLRLRPPRLIAGQTAALAAPAFHFDRALYDEGRRYCEKHYGLRTVATPDVHARHLFFAGSVERRRAELLHWLTAPQISAVIGIRGGYGCAGLYPLLRRDLLRVKNLKPKVVVGYSDLTILLNGLYQDLGWVTFHGPMIAGRPFRQPSPLEEETFRKCLMEGIPLGPIGAETMKTLLPGQAEGPLVGGCLSLMVSTLGTDYEIRTAGKVVFLEDIGEAPYRLHRMLTQLRAAGKFSRARAIVFGEFTDCEPHSDAYKDVSAVDAVKDALSGLPLPVVLGFPGGHGSMQCTFPIGMPVTVDAPARGRPRVVFSRPGVV